MPKTPQQLKVDELIAQFSRPGDVRVSGSRLDNPLGPDEDRFVLADPSQFATLSKGDISERGFAQALSNLTFEERAPALLPSLAPETARGTSGIAFDISTVLGGSPNIPKREDAPKLSFSELAKQGKLEGSEVKPLRPSDVAKVERAGLATELATIAGLGTALFRGAGRQSAGQLADEFARLNQVDEAAEIAAMRNLPGEERILAVEQPTQASRFNPGLSGDLARAETVAPGSLTDFQQLPDIQRRFQDAEALLQDAKLTGDSNLRNVAHALLEEVQQLERLNNAGMRARVRVSAAAAPNSPAAELIDFVQTIKGSEVIDDAATDLALFPERTSIGGAFGPKRVSHGRPVGRTAVRLSGMSDEAGMNTIVHEESHSMWYRMRQLSETGDPNAQHFMRDMDEAARLGEWRVEGDPMRRAIEESREAYQHIPPHGRNAFMQREEQLADMWVNASDPRYHKYLTPEQQEILEPWIGRFSEPSIHGRIGDIDSPRRLVRDIPQIKMTLPEGTNPDLARAFNRTKIEVLNDPVLGPIEVESILRSEAPHATDDILENARQLAMQNGDLETARALEEELKRLKGSVPLIQQEASKLNSSQAERLATITGEQ